MRPFFKPIGAPAVSESVFSTDYGDSILFVQNCRFHPLREGFLKSVLRHIDGLCWSSREESSRQSKIYNSDQSEFTSKIYNSDQSEFTSKIYNSDQYEFTSNIYNSDQSEFTSNIYNSDQSEFTSKIWVV